MGGNPVGPVSGKGGVRRVAEMGVNGVAQVAFNRV